MLRGRKRKLPTVFVPEPYYHGSESEEEDLEAVEERVEEADHDRRIIVGAGDGQGQQDGHLPQDLPEYFEENGGHEENDDFNEDQQENADEQLQDLPHQQRQHLLLQHQLLEDDFELFSDEDPRHGEQDDELLSEEDEVHQQLLQQEGLEDHPKKSLR